MPRKKTIYDKEKFIKQYRKNFGMVYKTCEDLKLSKRTYYEWLKDDETFKETIDDINELILDLVETALYKKIEEGDVSLIKFYLDRKGKTRGYGANQMDSLDTIPASFTVNIVKSNNEESEK